jgi:hypothetical protein
LSVSTGAWTIGVELVRLGERPYESPLAFEIVADDADGAAAVDVTPHGVAHVEDEPSLARRNEPVLGLLQFRLGNHELENLS